MSGIAATSSTLMADGTSFVSVFCACGQESRGADAATAIAAQALHAPSCDWTPKALPTAVQLQGTTAAGKALPLPTPRAVPVNTTPATPVLSGAQS